MFSELDHGIKLLGRLAVIHDGGCKLHDGLADVCLLKLLHLLLKLLHVTLLHCLLQPLFLSQRHGQLTALAVLLPRLAFVLEIGHTVGHCLCVLLFCIGFA